ncbi:MAG: hypothetical protein L0Y71_12860 [Gemmataceae bacterium]|nr:hypothetical protein [Gemmataceae bacterium]
MRTFANLLVVVLVVAAATLVLHAGADGVAGNWKVVLAEDGQPTQLWLLRLENKAGKLAGELVTLKGAPDAELRDLKVTGDLLTFELRLQARGGVVVLQFESKAPRAGAKRILGSVGSVAGGRAAIPAYLEATAAKNQFELDREVVTRTPNDPRVFGAVLDLIKAADDNKVPARDVQEWVDSVRGAAEAYGPRFQFDYTLQLLEALASQKGYTTVATDVAAQAETMPKIKASPLVQLRLLSTLHAAFQKSGDANIVKELDARIEKIEEPAFAEYSKTALDFTPAKFKGRKARSDRAVLVELFTGAMCPPCVAADLAFDALEKAFPPRDVVLLQYHLHVPGPDALTNADAEKRSDFYSRTLGGTPTIYFNGKPDQNVQGGGGREDAEDKFKEYRGVLETLVEKPAEVKLLARAVRKGDKIAIQASVKDVAKPGETTRLRLALVEDWVRYKARNGMLYHHRVVRAMPGGPAGVALMNKDLDHAVTVDLNELRADLHKYLDNYIKNESPFPDAQRPMRLRNLHVVAFVQNDDTLEVLQAFDAPVEGD